eukprot:scaffold410314_cov18-Prasinocladus_malaysianus.AAC.1
MVRLTNKDDRVISHTNQSQSTQDDNRKQWARYHCGVAHFLSPAAVLHKPMLSLLYSCSRGNQSRPIPANH